MFDVSEAQESKGFQRVETVCELLEIKGGTPQFLSLDWCVDEED